jgi:hypothetical protein
MVVDHEHVDRGDVRHVVLREAAPSGGGLFGSPQHVSPDGSLTHLDAELEQLAVNPRGAPERICGTHLADQIANLGGRLGSPDAPLTGTKRAGSPYDAIAAL